MTCGIYKLNFKGTNKVYIGKSKNIEYRIIKHRCDIKSSRSSARLQEAYLLYGMPELEILCECSESELNSLEAEAIEIYDSIRNGFNTVAASSSINTTYARGENSGNTKYSNSEIEEVFEYLTKYPELTYDDIAELTGVNKSTIGMLVCGQHHTWLKDLYPDEYNTLVSGNKREHINKHPFLHKFIKFIRLSNEFPSKTITELAELVDISEHILRNVSAGRTASKLLQNIIPEEYSVFMKLKYNRDTSRTTAEYKNKVVPKLINVYTGEIVDSVLNIAKFSRERNLTPSAIGAVINGKRPSHKGWKVLKE